MFLSLVFHNHQPVGQLPWTFEDAWRDSYQPFLDVLEKHPGIKVALHYTGPLLDWLLEHRPETVAQVRRLVRSGQVEVLGGGYYEPILAIWPVCDQIAQLVKLRDHVQEVFGSAPCAGTPHSGTPDEGIPDEQTPHGLWLAERVWEPQLVDVIAAMMTSAKSTSTTARQTSAEQTSAEQTSAQRASGGQTNEASSGAYTFIDSTVFEAAGITEEQSFGYFQITPTAHAATRANSMHTGSTHTDSTKAGSSQESASPVPTAQAVYAFPINQPLRYLIPWQDVEKSLQYFQHIEKQRRPESLVVFADDGEKFGGWPGTFDWVFTQGWLDRFFTMLGENAAWMPTVLPAEYMRLHPPLDSVHLPAGSYAEMQEWSGGNWRHFLERYNESGDMYDEVCRIGEALRKKPVGKRREQAHGHLLRAQCNDSYWHGAFGGLYLRHLRQAVYAEATRAQVLMDGREPFVTAEKETHGDIFVQNEKQKIGLRPVGGHAFLWTSKAARHNVLATLRRYPEKYHIEHSTAAHTLAEHSIASETDWYARGALIDHFFGPGTTPEMFATARYPEQGDFASEPWHMETHVRGETAQVHARRDGGVWVGDTFMPVSIEKELSLSAGSPDIYVAYTFINGSRQRLDLWWGTEWNVALTGNDLPDRHYHAFERTVRHRLDTTARFDVVVNPIVADRWLQLWVEWQFEEPMGMWHVPLFTVSQKEDLVIERTYQQSAFVFHRHIRLKPQAEYSLAFTATITSKRKL